MRGVKRNDITREVLQALADEGLTIKEQADRLNASESLIGKKRMEYDIADTKPVREFNEYIVPQCKGCLNICGPNTPATYQGKKCSVILEPGFWWAKSIGKKCTARRDR